jgi:hypothetical protein
MKRDKFSTGIRPHQANDIDVTTEEINPVYELKARRDSAATDTAHLELFRLEPSDSKRPSFSARWDWKENTVDIDLLGDPGLCKEFKADSDGYKGHHTTALSESPLTYQVDIRVPAEAIFRGTITLSVDLALFRKENVGEIIDQITDKLTILVECKTCGPVQVSGPPPYALDRCPKCKRPLSNEPQDSGAP